MRPLKALGLHLGAEYNGDHRLAGPPMGELVTQFLDGRLPDSPYFRCLIAQVRCFGDPRHFVYDDVSRLPAGGRHSEPGLYAQNVARSVAHHAQFIRGANPRLVLVGGGKAFSELIAQILPAVPDWRGDVVRLRNASPEGHRTEKGVPVRLWLDRYSEFRSTLLDDQRPAVTRLWHLYAPDAGTPFRLNRT